MTQEKTPTPQTKAVAKTEKKQLTIRDRLEGQDFRMQVAKALPRHLTPDRFIRVACTAMMRQPKLAECTQISFFNCLLTLSQLGLEPDGRRAHLIPFRNNKTNTTECTLIIDYKGLVELALRNGTISNIHADVVREGDLMDYDAGELKTHKPWFLRRDADKPEKAGEVYAVYCRIKFKDGTERCEVMSKDDVESIRARSKSATSGPWVTDWTEMSKKVVFKRASKWIVLSPELRDAVELDDQADSIGSPTRRGSKADVDPFTPTVVSVPEPAAETDDVPMDDAKPVDAVPVTLASLCAEQSVSEEQVCKYAAAKFKVSNVATVAELEEISPKRTAWMVEHWQEIVSEIKAA